MVISKGGNGFLGLSWFFKTQKIFCVFSPSSAHLTRDLICAPLVSFTYKFCKLFSTLFISFLRCWELLDFSFKNFNLFSKCLISFLLSAAFCLQYAMVTSLTSVLKMSQVTRGSLFLVSIFSWWVSISLIIISLYFVSLSILLFILKNPLLYFEL